MAAMMALVSMTASAAGRETKQAIKEEIQYHFKPYGFIRSYAFFDSRATKSLAEDMFFFIPLDEDKTGTAGPSNSVPSWNFQAISTRLGLDILGYKIGNTSITGKIESDFYCLNSSGNTGTLRMRQAFVKLGWAELGKKGTTNLDLLIGQTWHPMAADLVHGINLETGAPFSPFNRSAQIQFNASFGPHVTLTAAAISHLQYRSAGPAGASNKYMRHGLPEFYAGFSAKAEGFIGRIGVSIMNIRPQYGYTMLTGPEGATTVKHTDWLTEISPFAFAQYTKGTFQLKAKTILAQGGEWMQLNGGYAVTRVMDDGASMEYTPINSSVSFISAQYGKKLQVLGMVGYHRNLGTSKDIINMTDPNASYLVERGYSNIYFSGNGFKNIRQMVRFTPTLLYNLGRMQFGLEYDYTMVEYGMNLTARAIPENTHWVGNHRILFLAKFNL